MRRLVLLQDLYSELGDRADRSDLPDLAARQALTNRLIRETKTAPLFGTRRQFFLGEVAALLFKYGDGVQSKKVLFDLMQSKGQRVIDAPLRDWGARSSLVPMEERWDFAQLLYNQAKLDLPRLIWAQREVDPARAKPMIVKLAEETIDRNLFRHVARNAQQYHDPQIFRILIRRIEDLKLTADDLTWINERDYAEYLKIADDSELITALRPLEGQLLSTRECLPIIRDRRLLEHPNKEVRLQIARILLMFAQSRISDLSSVEALVNARLRTEPDAELATELSYILTAVAKERSFREKWRDK